MGENTAKDKEKILLVHTESECQKELFDIISPYYEIISFTSEDEAYDFLIENYKTISAGIFDISLGLNLIKKIRHNERIKNLPIVVSTNIDNSTLEDELLNLEVIDFLKTPFNARRVLNRLKTAVKLFEVNNVIDLLERDELTGLLTRQAFMRKAEQIRASNPNKHFAIIAFDFYNFKFSNGLYGEQKCNEFLSYTAKDLMRYMPEGISGRYGGDQFIIFYEYKMSVNIENIIRFRDSVLECAPIPHQVVKMGIYAPVDFEIPFVLCCDRAFLAIRDIKGIYGRDIAFYESSLQKQLYDEQRISETMERALEEEQFKIFYQPKHETITGKIAGAEALVRWEHPEYGFMTPNQFIPLFERNGFITKLDNYVLEHVCKDINRWQNEGIPVIPISVNVSRYDFLQPGVITRQYEIIDEYKIDHSYLHMEVTESLYCENMEEIISQVKQTREMGFMIEMDDFGAGYSSLGLLSSFPLDIIKLDISFVRNIATNEIVIENIIKMAHRMGLLTVAEGVESVEQFKTLKSLGCDFIQGFYFSKPIPVSEYEKYVKKTTVMSLGKITFPKQVDSDTLQLNENVLLAANEISEGMPGGFLSYHADGNLEIISYNHELMLILGCENAKDFRAYTGNSFKGFVPKDIFEEIQEEIHAQINSTNDIYYIEFKIKDKHERLKYLRLFGRFVKTEKYGDIYYVFVNDVTDEVRKKAAIEEERIRKLELQRAAKLSETASKAKDVFMNNFVKDILIPMRDIIDITDSISNNPQDTIALNKAMKKIKKSEERLMGYINDMFEVSSLEQNSIKVIEVPTDITAAGDRIYELIAESAKQKGIKIVYSTEIINPYVYQDIIHTTDVVMNILQNAIKYTPHGGTITFCLKQTPGKNKKECLVDFICEDTGIGISEEFLPHIGKSFVREDNEINEKIPSSGLGLHLAKSLMEAMGGTLEITSEKGKGTIVHTSQPHRYASAKDVKKASTLSANVRQIK